MTARDGSGSYFAEVISSAQHASVTVRKGRATETIAATSDVAIACDRLQYELAEGPCVDAALEQEPFVAGDLHADQRWPAWGPRVAGRGVHSVLSVPLSTSSEVLGALTL